MYAYRRQFPEKSSYYIKFKRLLELSLNTCRIVLKSEADYAKIVSQFAFLFSIWWIFFNLWHSVTITCKQFLIYLSTGINTLRIVLWNIHVIYSRRKVSGLVDLNWPIGILTLFVQKICLLAILLNTRFYCFI